VAVRNKFAPSSILMPVGFATLLGGMATTIGTSTNLLVVSIAADLGVAEFGMFSFTLPVLIVGSIGLMYLWLIAPRLLPARQPPMSDTSPRVFTAMYYVNDDSVSCGMKFSECLALTNNQMRVDRIQRGEGLFVAKLPSVRMMAGDRLVVRDTPERLKEFEKQIGATLHDEFGATGIINLANVASEQEHLAEIVVTRGAMLHRSTLAATRFAQRTGLLPLALHRARAAEGEDITSHIGLVNLRAGDIVLVQGTQKMLEDLKRTGNALVLDGTTNLPRSQRSNRAFAIMAAVVVAAATGLLPIVSNNAAGVIGAPIAVEMARELGVSPEAFILAVIFGANMSYATPFGYQTNLLVLSAGGYKFSDFLRAGIPLTLIMWLGFSIVLPMMYDL
jgi:di/tricarboxylate transporter